VSDIEAVAALQDPLRRRLYDYVVAQDHEVSRNEAAEAAGVARTLAAHHLDRLAEVGLLDTVSRRVSGRSGPGAGRPAKLYRRSGVEFAVSLPARDYRSAALLLAEVAEAAGLDSEVRETARRHARGLRRVPAGDLAAAAGVLAERGYEPVRDGDLLRMRNCPFHVLSTEFAPLVCGMNLALLEGLLEGSSVRMESRPGWCCVVVEPSKTNRS
jgi:predicted ArsR family transcriptional regulator